MAKEIAAAKNYFRGVVLITDILWGDGGKGKIADLGAQYSDVVVKTNGGANAGHTVCNEHGHFPLHLVPSGIFNPRALCVVGSGVAVDPIQFTREYTGLLNSGIPLAQCLLAEDAHMVMPWHKLRDNLKEKALGNKEIGTTGQGIGPAYADRTNREGLRLKDLKSPDFERSFLSTLAYQQRLIRAMDPEIVEDYFDPDKILGDLRLAREILPPIIADTRTILGRMNDEGRDILGEAGQGALLDKDMGGYPYVTSSHPGVIGFWISTGFRPNQVTGVAKAYATRVGKGPMPTEQNNGMGHHLQEVGQEVGVTSGRVRRCGWFDAVAAEYGVRAAGVTRLALTKLDVLDGVDQIKVCVGYRVDDQVWKKIYHADAEFMEKAEPVYETLPGWSRSTKEVRRFQDLPENARGYVRKIESLVDLPIDIVSVGPDREATIFRD